MHPIVRKAIADLGKLSCDAKNELRKQLPKAKEEGQKFVNNLPSMPGVNRSAIQAEVNEVAKEMERQLRC